MLMLMFSKVSKSLHLIDVLLDATMVAVEMIVEVLSLMIVKGPREKDTPTFVPLDIIKLVPSSSSHRRVALFVSHSSLITMPGKTVTLSPVLVTF